MSFRVIDFPYFHIDVFYIDMLHLVVKKREEVSWCCVS